MNSALTDRAVFLALTAPVFTHHLVPVKAAASDAVADVPVLSVVDVVVPVLSVAVVDAPVLSVVDVVVPVLSDAVADAPVLLDADVVVPVLSVAAADVPSDATQSVLVVEETKINVI
jgi:hypothetical protein